jgi:hypothetical protein
MGSCELGNEPLGSVKVVKFLNSWATIGFSISDCNNLKSTTALHEYSNRPYRDLKILIFLLSTENYSMYEHIYHMPNK